MWPFANNDNLKNFLEENGLRVAVIMAVREVPIPYAPPGKRLVPGKFSNSYRDATGVLMGEYVMEERSITRTWRTLECELFDLAAGKAEAVDPVKEINKYFYDCKVWGKRLRESNGGFDICIEAINALRKYFTLAGSYTAFELESKILWNLGDVQNMTELVKQAKDRDCHIAAVSEVIANCRSEVLNEHPNDLSRLSELRTYRDVVEEGKVDCVPNKRAALWLMLLKMIDEKIKLHVCEVCGSLFISEHENAKYCPPDVTVRNPRDGPREKSVCERKADEIRAQRARDKKARKPPEPDSGAEELMQSSLELYKKEGLKVVKRKYGGKTYTATTIGNFTDIRVTKTPRKKKKG